MGATGNENEHSQEYFYAYQWGSNVKLPYPFKAFHYERKCETFMVKTTPVTNKRDLNELET